MRQTILITMLVSLLVACGRSDDRAATSAPAPPTAAATAMTPEQLGELGAQIQRQPDRAEQLLAQHGLTAESFEREIRKVTQSPEASKRYAAAFKRTKA